jgi:hypothetical protein
LTTVAILFEYVFGLRANLPENRLVWDIRLLDECEISRYPFGREGLLNLHCASRQSVEEKPIVSAEADTPLTLELRWSGKVEEIE